MPNSKSMRPAPEAFARAAAYLGCDVAAIRAVAQVEAGSQGAFISIGPNAGRPTILFEPHIFDRLTNGRFRDAKDPLLSGPSAVLSRERWAPGTYGPFSAQYARLDAAAQLDRPAALKSCSWGLFQLMGENYRRCGFGSVEAFVGGMHLDVDTHLWAFAHFITGNESLHKALATRDWVTFARIYNGPGYRRNSYDSKLAAAYEHEAALV